MMETGIRLRQRIINLKWLIGSSLILLTPFIGWSGIDFRTAQMNFFQFGIVLFFSTFLPLSIGLFLIYATLSMFYYGVDQVSGTMFQMVFLGLIYFMMVKETAKKHLNGWINILIILAWINCAFVFMQAMGIHFYFREGGEGGNHLMIGHPGIMYHRVFQGILCALMFPIAIKKSFWLTIALAISIYFSHSTAAIGAAIIGIFFVLYFENRNVLLFLIPLLSGVFIWYSKYDFNSSQYMLIYQQAIPLIKHYWIGQGLGSFHKSLIVWKDAHIWWREAHNFPFQLFFEYGLIGLGFLFWLLGWIFFKVLKLKDSTLLILTASLFSFFICTLAQPAMHVVRISMVAVTITALIYSRIETLEGT